MTGTLDDKLAWGIRQNIQKTRRGKIKKGGSISFSMLANDPGYIGEILNSILEIGHYEGTVTKHETENVKGFRTEKAVYYTTDNRGREIPFAKVILGRASYVTIDTSIVDVLHAGNVRSALEGKGFVVTDTLAQNINFLLQGYQEQELKGEKYFIDEHHGRAFGPPDYKLVTDESVLKALGIEPKKEEPYKRKKHFS